MAARRRRDRQSRFRSTPPVDEQSLRQSAPLVNYLEREVKELERGRHNEDLARKTPLQQHVGTSGLGTTGDDHDAVQAMTTGVVGREPHFADGPTRYRNKTHHLDTGRALH